MTEPAAVTRLFIALWPTPALRQRLVAHQAAWNWPARTALTAHDDLHLTLHFIGAVPTSRLDEIQQGLRVDAPRIALALDSFEVWRNGCAVCRPGRTPVALAALHAALAQALRALDLPLEQRPFRPHVTLARHAIGATPPQAPLLHWSARGYSLVASADGRYTPLTRYA
jgi:2'-5' RNA ligase